MHLFVIHTLSSYNCLFQALVFIKMEKVINNGLFFTFWNWLVNIFNMNGLLIDIPFLISAETVLETSTALGWDLDGDTCSLTGWRRSTVVLCDDRRWNVVGDNKDCSRLAFLNKEIQRCLKVASYGFLKSEKKMQILTSKPAYGY